MTYTCLACGSTWNPFGLDRAIAASVVEPDLGRSAVGRHLPYGGLNESEMYRFIQQDGQTPIERTVRNKCSGGRRSH
jgi:hypothetical protein